MKNSIKAIAIVSGIVSVGSMSFANTLPTNFMASDGTGANVIDTTTDTGDLPDVCNIDIDITKLGFGWNAAGGTFDTGNGTGNTGGTLAIKARSTSAAYAKAVPIHATNAFSMDNFTATLYKADENGVLQATTEDTTISWYVPNMVVTTGGVATAAPAVTGTAGVAFQTPAFEINKVHDVTTGFGLWAKPATTGWLPDANTTYAVKFRLGCVYG